MKKKLQILLLLSINTTLLIGQTINLLNQTSNPVDSKIVYIGIENRFQVKEYESLEGIKSMNYVTLVKDNLTIKPTTPGKLSVTFITKNGKSEIITFQVREIPQPIIVIGENKVGCIDKSNIANNRVLSITSADSTESFFDGYNIAYFEVELNGGNFKINENQISEQLLKALDKSKSGDKLILSLVKVYNKKSGGHSKIDCNLIFMIN